MSGELVLRLLTEVVGAVHAAGGIAGIHVCANTDWLLAFQSNLDIINFDTYSYFDKFALYGKQCIDFIAGGGNMAWGVVPTSDPDAIWAETPESLANEVDLSQVRELATSDIGFEKILAHSLFTPGCGCGSLTEECAARVLDLLKGFCRIIRQGS